MKKLPFETNPNVLRNAVANRFDKLLEIEGSVTFKAIPSLAEHYAEIMQGVWRSLSKLPTLEEMKFFTDSLREELQAAFDESPHSKVVVSYKSNPPPLHNLTFTITIEVATMQSEYADWVANREGALFGEWPDQMVMETARVIANDRRDSILRILDIGAGTGRNALPLARLGHHVEAVEISTDLSQILADKTHEEGLDVDVFEGDIFEFAGDIVAFKGDKTDYHLDFVFLSEVMTHFSTPNQIRRIFELSEKILKVGGILLFNVFVAKIGYNPSDLLFEASEVAWGRVFTLEDIRNATGYRVGAGSCWEFVAQESCLQYEKDNTPPEHWPPTAWYEGWCRGQDVLDLPPNRIPFELRWLTFRKLR